MISEIPHETHWTSETESHGSASPHTPRSSQDLISEFTTLDPSDLPESLQTFHGQKECPSIPRYKKEKPIHRIILFLRAQGLSYREISEQTGMGMTGVSWLCSQAWFKEQLLALLNSQGIDPVKQLIQSAAVDSIYKVIELRDKAKSEAVQRDCAFDLLDRYLGKSVQPIGPEKAPIADEAQLDAEIAELQRKSNLN